MALLECPDCTGQLSSSAAACPHCGYRAVAGRSTAKHEPVRGWRALLILAAYAAGSVVIMYALPQYAIILAALAAICAILEIRGGFLRRAIGAR